jgi:hypothetical protein
MPTSTADPFHPSGALATGSWYNKTSTISVVYLPKHLPTPWPWLVASFTLSLSLSLVGIVLGASTEDAPTPISEVNQANQYSETMNPTVSIVATNDSVDREKITTGTILSRTVFVIGFTYTTFRAFALLSIFLRSQHHLVPFPASSAIMLLVFSTICYTCKTAGILQLFACAVSIMVSVICYLGPGSGPGLNWQNTYGAFIIAGGNCPSATCDKGDPYPQVIGCPKEPQILSDFGVIGDTDGLVGIIGVSYLSCIIVYLIFSHVFKSLLRRFRSRRSPNMRKPWKVVLRESCLRPWATKSGVAYGALLGTFFLSLVLAGIVIPIHVVYERKGQSVSYLDGFGPLTNGTLLDPIPQPSSAVWTDCFTIKSPTDRLGFWNDWRMEKGGQVIERFIAIL